MLRCNQAVELMGRDSGDPLPLGRRVALRIHLLMCRHCRAYMRGLKRMRHLVRMRTVAEDSVEPERVDDLVRRVQDAAEGSKPD